MSDPRIEAPGTLGPNLREEGDFVEVNCPLCKRPGCVIGYEDRTHLTHGTEIPTGELLTVTCLHCSPRWSVDGPFVARIGDDLVAVTQCENLGCARPAFAGQCGCLKHGVCDNCEANPEEQFLLPVETAALHVYRRSNGFLAVLCGGCAVINASTKERVL